MNSSTALRVLRQRCSPVRRITTSRSYATKQSGSAAQFYKTFTRPIGKVLVLAVFTYQVAYWTWTKLEADEARAEADETIAALESTVNEYKKTKEAKREST